MDNASDLSVARRKKKSTCGLVLVKSDEPAAPQMLRTEKLLWIATEAERVVSRGHRQFPVAFETMPNAALPREQGPTFHEAHDASVVIRAFNADLKQELAARTALIEMQAERMRFLALQVTTAELRERKRLAALLHDDVQQLLVAAKIHIHRVGKQTNATDTAAAIDGALQLIQQAIESTRSLTSQLCPQVLYEVGLGAALNWLTEETARRYGVDAVFSTLSWVEPAQVDVKLFLFHAVRELIFNAIKHARANKIEVRAAAGQGVVRIAVLDNGVGFDDAVMAAKRISNETQGLLSVQRQIVALGGKLETESIMGCGARVLLMLPLLAQCGCDTLPRRRPKHASRIAQPALE